MPQWFFVLSQVLALLAELVPAIEKRFGSTPGQGEAKKAAVMADVLEIVERSPDGAPARALTQEGRVALVRLASATVDQLVANANLAGVFTHAPAAPGEAIPAGGGGSPSAPAEDPA